jgi:hypothetical protein
VEIVKLIKEDEKLISEIFEKIKDEGNDEKKRREMVIFIKELCNF